MGSRGLASGKPACLLARAHARARGFFQRPSACAFKCAGVSGAAFGVVFGAIFGTLFGSPQGEKLPRGNLRFFGSRFKTPWKTATILWSGFGDHGPKIV